MINTHLTKNLLGSVCDMEIAVGTTVQFVRLGHRQAVSHQNLAVY